MGDSPRADDSGAAEDARLLAFAAARRGAVAGAGPCPDAAQLAGMVEDRLLPDEREIVETHVAVCDDCREVVAALAADPAEAAAPRRAAPRARLLRRERQHAAALLVAAAGLAAYLAQSTPSTE
jgi:hypothetical protein